LSVVVVVYNHNLIKVTVVVVVDNTAKDYAGLLEEIRQT